eukprot:COSAG06_NODE_11946_length_1443_cov_1.423363_1_plen_397_part_10
MHLMTNCIALGSAPHPYRPQPTSKPLARVLPKAAGGQMLTGRDTGAVQHVRGAEVARPRPREQRSHQRRSRRQQEVEARARRYDGDERYQRLSWEEIDDAVEREEHRRPPDSFREWWAFCTDEHLAAAAADGSREAWTAAHEFERAKWESAPRHARDHFAEWTRGPRDTLARGADPAVRFGQEPEPEPQQLQPAPTPVLTQPMRSQSASRENIAPRALSTDRGFAALQRRPRLQLPPSVHKPEELAAAREQIQAWNPRAALADTSNPSLAFPAWRSNVSPALPAWQAAPSSSQLPPPQQHQPQPVLEPKDVSYHTELEPTDDPEHAEGSAATVQQDRNPANSTDTLQESEQSLSRPQFSSSGSAEMPPPPPLSPPASTTSSQQQQQQQQQQQPQQRQ